MKIQPLSVSLPSRRADKTRRPMILAWPMTVVVTADVCCIMMECTTLYDKATALVPKTIRRDSVMCSAPYARNAEDCKHNFSKNAHDLIRKE